MLCSAQGVGLETWNCTLVTLPMVMLQGRLASQKAGEAKDAAAQKAGETKVRAGPLPCPVRVCICPPCEFIYTTMIFAGISLSQNAFVLGTRRRRLLV